MFDQSSELLHDAASAGNCAMIRQLIDEGWDVNLLDDIGQSPLHYAVGEKHLEAARLLLVSGADPNLRDLVNNGSTPLDSHVSPLDSRIRKCSLEMAKLLLDYGADPTLRTWMNMNALQRVEYRGIDDPVYQLLHQWEMRAPDPDDDSVTGSNSSSGAG